MTTVFNRRIRCTYVTIFVIIVNDGVMMVLQRPTSLSYDRRIRRVHVIASTTVANDGVTTVLQRLTPSYDHRMHRSDIAILFTVFNNGSTVVLQRFLSLVYDRCIQRFNDSLLKPPTYWSARVFFLLSFIFDFNVNLSIITYTYCSNFSYLESRTLSWRTKRELLIAKNTREYFIR